MRHRNPQDLVLGIYTTTRGFAFGLFEGHLAPVDWGVVEIKRRNKNAACIERIGRLIERHHPDILVVEDCAVRGSRRSPRIRRLYRAIIALAQTQSIETYRYSRVAIRTHFSELGAVTKQEIAQAIAKNLPAFEHRLPPVRRPWMSEDLRMGLFDAASLVFTYYLAHAERGPRA